LLDQVRQQGLTRHIVILDYGEHKIVVGDTSGDFVNYRPEALFYSLVEASRGMQVEVGSPEPALAPGSWIATCDPRSYAWLSNHYQVTVALHPNRWCEVGRTAGVK
jgi:hypothetical protein